MIYKGSERLVVETAALANRRQRRISARRPTGLVVLPDGTVTMGRVTVTAEPRPNECDGQVFPLGDPIPS